MEELPRVALRFTLTQRKPWDFTHSEIVTWRGFGAGHEVINILKKSNWLQFSDYFLKRAPVQN